MVHKKIAKRYLIPVAGSADVYFHSGFNKFYIKIGSDFYHIKHDRDLRKKLIKADK
jgi:hypothetical protein